MKHILIFVFAIACQACLGQTNFRLWGLSGLGDKGSGNVFSVSQDGTDFLKINSFSQTESVTLGGKLSKSTDGFLYGVSYGGGKGYGAIFRIKPDGTGYAVVFSFDGMTGINPPAGVVEGPDGFLYGFLHGGPGNVGRLFKVARNGTGFTTLLDFDNTTGGNPIGAPLIIPNGTGPDGFVYGVTVTGGSQGAGTVFKISTTGTLFTKLYDFQTSDGVPNTGLILANNGNIYGTTGTVGSSRVYGIQNGVYSSVYQTSFSSDAFNGDLIQGSNSKLYGISSAGPAFSMNLDGTGFNLIYDFGADQPIGSLTQLSTGEIVGLTQYGGAYGRGMIFKLNAAGYSKILDLSIATGTSDNYELQSSITESSPGVMMVLTNVGGTSNTGTIFTVTPGGTYVDVKKFPLSGAYPSGNLIRGTDGDMYGVTNNGGADGSGTIFKVSTSGNYTQLYEFQGTANGSSPNGRLVQNASGTLFGTTAFGGVNNTGVIFKVESNGTGFAKLHDFDAINGVAGGTFPFDGLLLANDNVLYGTTRNGGSIAAGIAFKIQQNGSGFTKILDFTSAGGTRPYGLIQGTDGNLYGVGKTGGANGKGVIYTMTLAATGYSKLHEFNGMDGSTPSGALIQGSDGNLYGTTESGGVNDKGTVFRIATNGTGFQKLVDFDGANKGSILFHSTLIEAPDGLLYGMTNAGGINNVGVLFKLKKDGTAFTKIMDFNTSTGCGPAGGLIAVSGAQVLPISITSFSPTSGFGATTSTAGTSVVISGSNFSTSNANNVVKFNGVAAVVTTSSATSITTTVPSGASTGRITVTTNGQLATSSSDFTVLLPTGDLNPESGEEKIVFYPNPSSDNIIVDLSHLDQGKPVQVTIHDMNGRQIEAHESVVDKTMSIDIRQYGRGNFIIRAVQDRRKYACIFSKQ